MKRLLVAAAAAVSSAGAADAAEVLKAVPGTFDPSFAYGLVEVRNFDGGPASGVVVFARYDSERHDVRGGLHARESALPKDKAVSVATASHSLAKGEKAKLYLIAFEPDTWVIEGAQGTAFSLGSRSFVLRAGDVVDLGVMTPGGDYPEGEGPFKLNAGNLAAMALLGPFAKKPKARPAMLVLRARGDGDLAVPAPLQARIQPVAFTDGAKFGNYLGSLANRLDGRRGRPGPEPGVPSEPAAAAPQADPPSAPH
jgi:hypothetical protein